MQAKRIFSFFFCFLLMSTIFLTALPDKEFQNKKRIRENLNTLRLLRMTQALDLTEEQTAKIFPAINRIEKEKMEIQREIGQKIKELRLILDKEKPGEQEIEEVMQDWKGLRNTLKSKDEELENFIEENLTLVQRAKHLLFLIDFYKGIREKMDRARWLQQRLSKRDKRIKK